MTSIEIGRRHTDTDCPASGCTAQLDLVEYRKEGTAKIYETFECAVDAGHIPDDWVPPEQA